MKKTIPSAPAIPSGKPQPAKAAQGTRKGSWNASARQDHATRGTRQGNVERRIRQSLVRRPTRAQITLTESDLETEPRVVPEKSQLLAGGRLRYASCMARRQDVGAAPLISLGVERGERVIQVHTSVPEAPEFL